MFCKWCGRKFDDFSIKCPYCSGQQDALMNGNGFWDLCVFESNPMLIKIDGNDAVGKPLVSDDKNLKQVEQTCEVKDALPAAEKTEAAAPPVKPNKTNKPLVIILSSIICILVVGFIVLLVTMLNKSNDSKSNTEESAVSSSSSVPANEDKTDESDLSAGHKDSDTDSEDKTEVSENAVEAETDPTDEDTDPDGEYNTFDEGSGVDGDHYDHSAEKKNREQIGSDTDEGDTPEDRFRSVFGYQFRSV